METLGERIRRMRLEKDISQRQFAKLIGTSPGLISFIERDRNKPSYFIIGRMSKVLGTTTDFLIFGEQTEPVTTQELINRLRSEIYEENLSTGELKITPSERELIEKHDVLGRLSRMSRTDLEIVLEIVKKIEGNK
jgi:transcriptional regulator with XRE-family HTH domain